MVGNMITYEWIFNDLLVKPIFNDMQDVLHIVHWTIRGVNENGVEAVQSGSCSLPDPDPGLFIPFSSLTKSKVEELVTYSIGLNTVTAIKRSIVEQIGAKVNPPVISVQPPWA